MQAETTEVIIIGAGISGIAASQVLTQRNIPHLLLESRDRVGGRIASTQFDGVDIELGASFVHCPHYQNNFIAEYVRKNNMPTIPSSFSTDTYYYQNQHILPHNHINKAWNTFSQMKQFARKLNQNSKEDISVQTMFEEFMKVKSEMSQHVRNTLRWIVHIYSNVQGGDLNQLSLREYLQSQVQSQHDFLPKNGYSSVVHHIFQSCNPELKLSHKVVEIDYSEASVKIATERGIFSGKYVIASLPLGVLQQQKVRFTPPLPQEYTQGLKSIGNGVANKLFVSFEKPFWGKRKGWLNFITKSKHNPYPVGLILPQCERNILLIFISATYSIEMSQRSDEEVIADFLAFLSKFVKDEIKVRAFMMTRWHLDQNSLGSYSYCKPGHDQTEFAKKLGRLIQHKIWLVGEHLHAEMNACAHSAYETGLRAAEEVANLIDKAKPK